MIAAHLRLDRMDLLGHSAAGDLAVLYTAAHPERVGRLILVTPSLRALGLDDTEEAWRAALARRSGERWYPDALAAIEKAEAGDDSLETRRAYTPFLYGRWNDAARAHSDVGVSERSRPVRAHFAAEGAFRPAATRADIGQFTSPVLVYAGELDSSPTVDGAAAGARLFPNATVTVQPGAAHFPWHDDPAFFTAAISRWLASTAAGQSQHPARER